jgi:beta-xylosidase
MTNRWRRAVAPLLVPLLLGVVAADASPAGAYAGAPWFEPSKPYTANFPDPSVVVDGATYLAYGTATGGAYLPVLSSTDTVTWTARPRYAQPACVGGTVDPYFNDALPCPARWAPDRAVGGRMTKEVWAPGVARIGGRSVAFYAVRERLDIDRFCISVATASDPLGPFTDDTTGPLVCDADPNGSIDPQPFVDGDGSAWLLWKSEGVPGATPTRIWSRRLAADGTSFAPGSTATELLRTSQAWESDVVENPAMIRHGGRLALFYSGNEHLSARYAIGLAECASPSGPCTKSAANPIITSAGDHLGPGGPAPFTDAGGALRVAHHHWTAPYTSYPAHPACLADRSCTTQGQRRMAVATRPAPGERGRSPTGDALGPVARAGVPHGLGAERRLRRRAGRRHPRLRHRLRRPLGAHHRRGTRPLRPGLAGDQGADGDVRRPPDRTLRARAARG